MPRPKIFQNGLVPDEKNVFHNSQKWKPAEESEEALLRRLKAEKEAQKATNMLITKRRT